MSKLQLQTPWRQHWPRPQACLLRSRRCPGATSCAVKDVDNKLLTDAKPPAELPLRDASSSPVAPKTPPTQGKPQSPRPTLPKLLAPPRRDFVPRAQRPAASQQSDSQRAEPTTQALQPHDDSTPHAQPTMAVGLGPTQHSVRPAVTPPDAARAAWKPADGLPARIYMAVAAFKAGCRGSPTELAADLLKLVPLPHGRCRYAQHAIAGGHALLASLALYGDDEALAETFCDVVQVRRSTSCLRSMQQLS